MVELTKDDIGFEILAYFAEHPAAKDTAKGIADWWLLSRRIELILEQASRDAEPKVVSALRDYVAAGLLLEEPGRAHCATVYRLNPERQAELQRWIEKKRGK